MSKVKEYMKILRDARDYEAYGFLEISYNRKHVYYHNASDQFYTPYFKGGTNIHDVTGIEPIARSEEDELLNEMSDGNITIQFIPKPQYRDTFPGRSLG